jgi:hypothetical protein
MSKSGLITFEHTNSSHTFRVHSLLYLRKRHCEVADEVAHGRGEQELGYLAEVSATDANAPWLLQGPWYLGLPITPIQTM